MFLGDSFLKQIIHSNTVSENLRIHILLAGK